MTPERSLFDCDHHRDDYAVVCPVCSALVTDNEGTAHPSTEDGSS